MYVRVFVGLQPSFLRSAFRSFGLSAFSIFFCFPEGRRKEQEETLFSFSREFVLKMDVSRPLDDNQGKKAAAFFGRKAAKLLKPAKNSRPNNV